MVRGAEPHARRGDTGEHGGKRRPVGHQDREMIEPGRFLDPRRDAGLHLEKQQGLAAGPEHETAVAPLDQLEADHVAVPGDRALRVGHAQRNRADLRGGGQQACGFCPDGGDLLVHIQHIGQPGAYRKGAAMQGRVIAPA